MDSQKVLASGLAERIGEPESVLFYKPSLEKNEIPPLTINKKIKNHKQGLSFIVELLVDPQKGVIKNQKEITAIGHRVVHGGEHFQEPVLIDHNVIAAIKNTTPLAPLHNPSNLAGIEVAKNIFPGTNQVAVFDTAFHQTLPKKAYLYAIPCQLYKNYHVRRYGFHGISNAYVAEQFSEYVDIPLNKINVIILHLGNGASMTAIENGQCIDTTMGMTPLEGLVMGTRSGDIDPSLMFFLSRKLKMKLNNIEKLLITESGLKGICGTNDMRKILQRRAEGDTQSEIAVQIYCYRIKKYIGAYMAVLGKIDGIIFTAGIGENAPEIRKMACERLDHLGLIIDVKKNDSAENTTREIQSSESKIKIMVIPTNEELKIAQETKKVVDMLT